MRKKILFIISAVFLSFICLYQIANIPGLNGDAAWFMSKTLDIKAHGLFKNISGMGNYTGVLHPYLMYLTNLIFSDLVAAGRILNLFSVILIIFLIIKLLKNQIGENNIILLILLFTLNPFNFGFFRIAWPHSLLPLFSILGIFLFLKYIRTQKVIFIIYTLIIAGLGTQLHPVMFLQVIFYIFYILIYQRPLAKKIIFSKTFIILAICFVIGSFSVIIFNTAAVKRLFSIHFNTIVNFGFFKVFNTLLFRFIDYTKIFLYNFTGLRALQYFSGIIFENIFITSILLIFSILLLLSAFKNCLAKNNILTNIFGMHTLFFFFVIPFFLEFGGFNMHKFRLGEERIFLIITPTIFINFILVINNLKNTIKKIFYSFTILIIAVNIFNISYNYFYNFKTTGGNGEYCYYINQRDIKLIAAEFISTKFSDTDTLIFVQDYWLYWPLKIYLHNSNFEIYYAPKCKIPREGFPKINDFTELYDTYKNRNLIFVFWYNYNDLPIAEEIQKLKLINTIEKTDKFKALYIFQKN